MILPILSAATPPQRWHSSAPPDKPPKPPKYHQLPFQEKRQILITQNPLLESHFKAADAVNLAYLEQHGEMMVAAHSLPLSAVPKVKINGKEGYSFVGATEESSVFMGLGAKNEIIFRNGGYQAIPATPIMHNHVQLIGPLGMSDEDVLRMIQQISDKIPEYLKAINTKFESMFRRTGGFLSLEVYLLPPTKHGENVMLEIRGKANTGDAQGAVYLTNAAEFLRVLLVKDTGLIPGMGILCQNGDERVATASIRLNPKDLTLKDKEGKILYTGEEMAQRLVWGSQFSWRVKGGFRSDTEAKGVLNYMAAQTLAVHGDTRGFDIAFARYGTNQPLTRWWRDEEGFVNASLSAPTVEGTVGGDRSPQAKLALALSGAKDAAELSMLSVCGGLCQTFAAMYSLLGVGIINAHVFLVEKRKATDIQLNPSPQTH